LLRRGGAETSLTLKAGRNHDTRGASCALRVLFS